MPRVDLLYRATRRTNVCGLSFECWSANTQKKQRVVNRRLHINTPALSTCTTDTTDTTDTDRSTEYLTLLVNKSRPRQRIPPHLLSLFKMSESKSWTTNSSRRRVKKQSFSRKTRLSGPSEQQHTPRLGSVSFPDYSRADQMNAVSGNKEEEPMANQISFPTPHYGQQGGGGLVCSTQNEKGKHESNPQWRKKIDEYVKKQTRVTTATGATTIDDILCLLSFLSFS